MNQSYYNYVIGTRIAVCLSKQRASHMGNNIGFFKGDDRGRNKTFASRDMEI